MVIPLTLRIWFSPKCQCTTEKSLFEWSVTIGARIAAISVVLAAANSVFPNGQLHWSAPFAGLLVLSCVLSCSGTTAITAKQQGYDTSYNTNDKYFFHASNLMRVKKISWHKNFYQLSVIKNCILINDQLQPVGLQSSQVAESQVVIAEVEQCLSFATWDCCVDQWKRVPAALRHVLNFHTKKNQIAFVAFTRCVRKVSDLRLYLRVSAILRHPDRGILRSSPRFIEPHAPSGASTS